MLQGVGGGDQTSPEVLVSPEMKCIEACERFQFPCMFLLEFKD